LLKHTYSSLAAAAVIALALAGCSSDDSSNKGSTSSGSDAGQQEAKTFVDETMANPTGIGYDSPITEAPPADATIVALEAPVAVAKKTNDYRESATELLGWNMSRIVVGPGPEDPAKALDQALDARPDSVFYAGYNPEIISEQLARAKSDGVPVVAESVTVADPAVVGTVRNAASNDRLAKMSAAFVVSDSKGDANVEFFSVPSQPIVSTYYDSFKKYLAQWCPDCKVHVNNFEFTDIGSNLPGQVVSALQRNPEANYAVFGLGDAMIGVDAALQSAGLGEQVKLGGAIPSLDNYEALRNGTQAFWAADAGPTQAWRETDLMVRAMLGEDLAVVNDAPPISQLLTPDNIDAAVFDDDGYWLGYDGYVADYKKQWGLN
jgi:ribose transport system substrate-binding protein